MTKTYNEHYTVSCESNRQLLTMTQENIQKKIHFLTGLLPPDRHSRANQTVFFASTIANKNILFSISVRFTWSETMFFVNIYI